MPDPPAPPFADLIEVTEGQLRKLVRLTRKMHEHHNEAKATTPGSANAAAAWQKAHNARKRVDDYLDSLITASGVE